MSENETMEKLTHSPTLNTILMVESVIKNSENSIITIPEIKRLLPKQVNHRTLMVILEYLEESGKILVTIKGITWIHNSNKKLQDSIKNGPEL